MKCRIQPTQRGQYSQFVHVLFFGVLGFNFSCALPVENNGFSSIIDEHKTCNRIIPQFVEQIMSHKAPNCNEQGVFPQPGTCSVFFKCVQSDTKIQPFVEYCHVGYNFVNSACIPNTNSSDCPQYTCRIPDAGTSEIGNELDVNDEPQGIQSLPLVVPPSTTTGSMEPASSTASSTAAETSNAESENGVDQDEHVVQMQMTQNENSSGSYVMLSKSIILLYAIMFSFRSI